MDARAMNAVLMDSGDSPPPAKLHAPRASSTDISLGEALEVTSTTRLGERNFTDFSLRSMPVVKGTRPGGVDFPLPANYWAGKSRKQSYGEYLAAYNRLSKAQNDNMFYKRKRAQLDEMKTSLSKMTAAEWAEFKNSTYRDAPAEVSASAQSTKSWLGDKRTKPVFTPDDKQLGETMRLEEGSPAVLNENDIVVPLAGDTHQSMYDVTLPQPADPKSRHVTALKSRRETAQEDPTLLKWEDIDQQYTLGEAPQEAPEQQPPPPPPPPPPPAEAPAQNEAENEDDKKKEEEEQREDDDNVDKKEQAASFASNVTTSVVVSATRSNQSLADPRLAHKDAINDLTKAEKDLDKALAKRAALYNASSDGADTEGGGVDSSDSENFDITQDLVDLIQLGVSTDSEKADTGSPEMDGIAAAKSPKIDDELAIHFAEISHLHVASLRKVSAAEHLSRVARSQVEPHGNMPSEAAQVGKHIGSRVTEGHINSMLMNARKSRAKNVERVNAERAAHVIDKAVSKAQKAEREAHQDAKSTRQQTQVDSTKESVTAQSAEETQQLKVIERRNGNAAYIQSLVKKLSAASKQAQLHPGKSRYEKAVASLKEHLKKETNGLRTGYEKAYKQKLAKLDADRRKRQIMNVEHERVAGIESVLQHSKTSLKALKDAQQKVAEATEAVHMPRAQALAKELETSQGKHVKFAKQRMEAQADEKILKINSDSSRKNQMSELRQKASFSPRDIVKSVEKLNHDTRLMPAAPVHPAMRQVQKHAKARSAEAKAAANRMIENVGRLADERANEREKDCALGLKRLQELQSRVVKAGCLLNTDGEKKMCKDFQAALAKLNNHVLDIGC